MFRDQRSETASPTLTDDEMRAHPAFVQLYACMRPAVTIPWMILPLFLVCALGIVFYDQRWAVVPAAVLAAATAIVQLVPSLRGRKLSALIADDPATQVRAVTLAMRDASPPFGRWLYRDRT